MKALEPLHNGTQTSLEAAWSVRTHTQRLRDIVFHAIDHSSIDGATCDEIEISTGLSHQSCSARFNELSRLSLIVPIGTRRTRSGRKAVVYCTR